MQDYARIAELRPHLNNSMRFLAVTATASRTGQKDIAFSLGMRIFLFVASTFSLNTNIFIAAQLRPPSTGGKTSVEDSYFYIFKPLFLELFHNYDFGLTIVYTKLQWCAAGVQLAKQIMGKRFLTEDKRERVVQFHASQPRKTNDDIIKDIQQEDSAIRIVFATIALGMGCDLQHVRRIIHAGPPCTIEAYVQEVGRAGRDGSNAKAQMFYNANDVSQKNIGAEMKELCKLKEQCRREYISEYLNSSTESVSLCCDICDDTVSSAPSTFRIINNEQRQQVTMLMKSYVESDPLKMCETILTQDVTEMIAMCCEFIESEQHVQDIYDFPQSICETVFNIIQCVIMAS